VFDDFAACTDWLVRSNYTKPSKLAIEGGSNGGLLMGATLTQHPDLMQAVVSHVGIYDMLRVELDPNGAFNVTEFGSVKDREQFQALYAYSPYQHVKNKTPYPAVLMLTGENDGRVNPAHSRKMIARLQNASSSKSPTLLRTSARSGHGIGTALEERIEELADVYAFLIEQLGIDYTLVERGPWSGAVTPTSAVVKAKLPLAGMTARLVVSKNALLTRPILLPSVRAETNHYQLVEFAVQNLQPNTHYYYALEVDGRLDRASRGEFSTFPPPGPASFQIAFASCARTA
jgi:predicted esterase